jgi:hypothetical protein
MKEKQAASLVKKANQADVKRFRLRALLRLQDQERRQRVDAYSKRLRNVIQQSSVKEGVNTLRTRAQRLQAEQTLAKQRFVKEAQANATKRQLETQLSAKQTALNQRIANLQYKKRLQNVALEKKITNAQIEQTRKAQALRQALNTQQASQSLLLNAQQMARDKILAAKALVGNRTKLIKNVAIQKRLNQANVLKTRYMQSGLVKNKPRLAALGQLNAQSTLALQLATASAGTPQITKTSLQSMALQPSINARSKLSNQALTA